MEDAAEERDGDLVRPRACAGRVVTDGAAAVRPLYWRGSSGPERPRSGQSRPATGGTGGWTHLNAAWSGPAPAAGEPLIRQRGTTVSTVVIVTLAWLALALVVGLVVAGAVRLADRRKAAESEIAVGELPEETPPARNRRRAAPGTPSSSAGRRRRRARRTHGQ
jgi:hypothetical protein